MKTIEIHNQRGSLFGIGLVGLLILLPLAAFVIWFLGSSNPVTPAGYVGYLTKGAIFGRERFYGLQTGPTSPGRSWLLKVTNVSITPYTYNEEFYANEAVLSKDNLKIAFRVHIVWKVKRDQARIFVEQFSTLYGKDKSDELVEDAYKNLIREPLRTAARDEIQKLEGLKIKDEISPIGERIEARMLGKMTNTPFEVINIVVGNIQYPEQVANAVSLKLAATQDLERKQIEIEQEKKDAEKRIIQAGGIATSMETINTKLTPAYLQHEAIEAQKAMINSPNHTTIYIPVGPMGVPIVGTLDTNPHGKTP